jgi:signal transduction histidine kinase
VDLSSLLESVCTDYQEVGKPVVFQHSGERQVTLGNAVDLRRAFSNLIDNAIKYTPKESILTVTLSKKKFQHFVLLTKVRVLMIMKRKKFLINFIVQVLRQHKNLKERD